MAGPLQDIRVVEFAGLGPGPFCAMMLADHGADVIRIDRPGNSLVAAGLPGDALGRSRRSITLNTKHETGLALARQLCKSADAIIEGYRPGVMERLGLGPDVLLGDNPKLVYGRMTGWGQTGPLAQAAGHDINYIALSGVLGTCGRKGERPVPPVNYLGDFGGGGMMLAFGIVSALLHVRNGGEGQVIDAAMTDGSALLSAMTWSQLNSGLWKDKRGVNWLDTGAHFYDTYECADGECISIGAIEPQFYSLLREKAGLEDAAFDAQLDASKWPELKDRLADIFLTRTRAEWCEIMEGTDVCFAPVLGLREARDHPHNRARETFIEVGGHPMPAPAPRYSSTQTAPPRPAPSAGADSHSVLEELGYEENEIAAMRAAGVLG